MRIQNNLAAMNTHRQLSLNQAGQAKATEKLSSGYRINRAGDDAAGLSISEKMRAQIRGLGRASSNAQDGISMIQAAEGALQETHSVLQRIRELAVQGANDVNEDVDRSAIVSEINQLGVELDRIATTTNFNGKYILSGAYASEQHANGTYAGDAFDGVAEEIGMDTVYGPLNIQVGANTLKSDVIQISFRGVTAKNLMGEQWTQIDDFAARLDPLNDDMGFIPSETADTDINEEPTVVGTDGDDREVSTGGFQALIRVLDGRVPGDGTKINDTEEFTGIKLVNELRSQLGAVQNRLEHTVSNLDSIAENMQAAETRIRDVDMAKEMMTFTTQNILNQAATAMLAQANQAPQNILSLIR